MAGDRDPQVDRDLPGRSDSASTSEGSSRRSRRASSNGGRRSERDSSSDAQVADVEKRRRPEKRGGTALAENDRASGGRGEPSNGITRADLNALLAGLRDLRSGDFAVRLPRSRDPLMADIVSTFNDVASRNERMAKELSRISDIVGRKGDMTARVSLEGMTGGWADSAGALNSLVTDLVAPTSEVARVIKAVANGDLSQKMVLEIDGKSVQGEFLRIGTTVNTMVDQLNAFASEVTRVAKEVGTEGKLGGQAQVPGVAGAWKDLTDNVNYMASNLTNQVRNIADVTTAVAKGDLSRKITVDVRGELLELKNTVNTMVDQLNGFASEVTRVAREVGTEGKLGGQASVPGVAGTWKDLTDSVNGMAGNLTVQLRDVSGVATAIASGDLTRKITVEAQGEILQIKDVINKMVDSLSIFAGEVTRVAREVGAEGRLGGQANVPGVAGTWKDLTDNVNFMASSLTTQVRNIAEVTTAVAKGDLSKKITVDVKGEVLDLKTTINVMVDQLSGFAAEVTRVAKEVGSEGRLGGQANVPGVAGTWKDLTDNVNVLAGNLTTQVRNIAQVTTAVARGDLSQKITVDVRGEILELKNTVNTMVDQLNSFADEVTRVAREVGSEGRLGGQAKVPGAAGVWRDLTDNVNGMASNLTNQVRNIADVTTAVAKGDLSRKITVDARGEILELKSTVNTMVDQLNAFADEVTRVAKEVGTEGKLGGQAEVPGVAGTWKDLTDSVNLLANNLTVQVRSIADVATAVTRGDLSRQITVQAQGELDELKKNINQMIANLKNTTEANAEQDWLKTNLAKFSRMMQGQKDLDTVARLIMSELTPLVQARQGAFFIMQQENGNGGALRLIASYAYKERKHLNNVWHLGEGLVGQAALEKKPILLTNVPSDYIQIASGLGEAPPKNIIVLPILFEGDVKAVVELASFLPFSQIHQTFLDQLQESIGVVLNMIAANMRTEELLRAVAEAHAGAAEPVRGAQAPAGRAAAVQLGARAAGAHAQAVRGDAQGPAGGAAAGQRGAGGEGESPRRAEQEGRAEERGGRVRTRRARGEGRAAVGLVAVQERVPGEHVARAAHAAQLAAHPRAADVGEQGRQSHAEADRVCEHDPDVGYGSPDPHQRRARPVQGRGGEDGGESDGSGGDRRPRSDRQGLPPGRGSETARVHGRGSARNARAHRHRRAAPASGAQESPVECVQVHAPGPREPDDSFGRAWPAVRELVARQRQLGDRVRGERHGDRHREGQAAADLRVVPAGGRGDEPQVWRHGARPLDQPRDRAVVRRRDSRREHAGGGEHVHALPPRYVCRWVRMAGRRGTRDGEGRDAGLGTGNRRGAGDNATSPAREPRATCQSRQLTRLWRHRQLANANEGGTRAAARARHRMTLVEDTQVDPVTEGDAEAAASTASRVPRPASPPDDRDAIQPTDRVVLIVENDLNFARVLLEMAREKGFLGLIALDGETGIHLAHEYKPDAITLDIDMPGIDGWQVLDRLKHSHRHAAHPRAHHLGRRPPPAGTHGRRDRVPGEAGRQGEAR